MISISSEIDSKIIISLLLHICEMILINHEAVLRGQTVTLPLEATKDFGFVGIYFSIPSFIEDEFAVFVGTEPPTVIVWAMPIYLNELKFVQEYGWSKFEDILEKRRHIPFSLSRKSFI